MEFLFAGKCTCERAKSQVDCKTARSKAAEKTHAQEGQLEHNDWADESEFQR